MILRIVVAFAVLASGSASAVSADAKYTPEIRGRLTRGAQPVTPSNVCLRRSGSEVRQCGYVDFDGWFRIPSSGPMFPAKAEDKQPRGAYPSAWLEIGTGLDATGVTKRLAPVRLVDEKTAVLWVECDIAHDGVGAGDDPAYCRASSATAGANARSGR